MIHLQQKTERMGPKSFQHPLTKDQESLLSHGPKFVIIPKQTPVSEYITAVEQACTKLSQGESEELRVEVKRAVKMAQRSLQTSARKI